MTKSPGPDDTYRALTTREGLAAWWTNNTQGEGKVGGVLQFRFGAGGFDMKVLELDPAGRVLWQVIDGPVEWIGTKVSFDLRKDGDFTVVLFKHQNWKEPLEFMHHYSTKWAIFLMSLKSLLETGHAACDEGPTGPALARNGGGVTPGWRAAPRSCPT